MDLSESAFAFQELVWPAIKTKIGGGELRMVESVSPSDFTAELDMLAGIDAWQVVGGTGIRGIASRVQPTNRNWRTFTIRYTRSSGAETEWAKRMRAIAATAEGYLIPHYTVQAYTTNEKPIEDRRLIGAAVVKTLRLFTFAQWHMFSALYKLRASNDPAGLITGQYDQSVFSRYADPVYIDRNDSDGNQFIVVRWDGLANGGVQLIEI